MPDYLSANVRVRMAPTHLGVVAFTGAVLYVAAQSEGLTEPLTLEEMKVLVVFCYAVLARHGEHKDGKSAMEV